MKRIIWTIFFVFFCIYIYSLDITASYYNIVRITDNKLYYSSIENIEKEYDITWEKINNTDYIQFNYTGTFLDYYKDEDEKLGNGIKRFLILYGGGNENQTDSSDFVDFIFFYDSDNKLAAAFWSRLAADNIIPAFNKIIATSEYRERNIVYKPENLINYAILQPLVENASDEGITEKIRLECNNETGGVGKQYIPDRRSEKIQIEILEVYKGNKWNDTCINKIFPFELLEMR